MLDFVPHIYRAPQRRRLSERNAAIIAAREARPKLPPNWGASFVPVQRSPVVMSVAPPAPLMRDADALYRVLTLLADSCARLPRLSDLGLRMGARGDGGNAARLALEVLEMQGRIRQWEGAKGSWPGQRVVLLVDGNRELRTDGAPPHIRIAK